jgi:hypothetical protein
MTSHCTGKAHYPSAAAAWHALTRRLHRATQLTSQARLQARHHQGHRVGMLRAYRCTCGGWCLGHQPVKY